METPANEAVDDRRCERCGGSMEGRPKNAKYCESCSKDVVRERKRERQRRRRRDPEWKARRRARRRAKRAAARGERVCVDCGEDISERGARSTRCEECQREWKKRRRKEARRKRMGIGEDRRCEECGRSIADRHANAKYCKRCAKLRRTKRGRKYMSYRRQTDPAFRQRKAANWPCYRHRAELLEAQGGRCGICLEPMPPDKPDEWWLNRIRPEAAGGKWEKANCQVVHRKCGARKGAHWEGTMAIQVATWALWKLGK